VSRNARAPCGFACPYRDNCPHLDGLSTTRTLEVYQEALELRMRLGQVEQRYEKRVAELEQALKERDEKIAQLQVAHRKRFKAEKKPPIRVTARRRGAPVGHPAWRRREPDHVDEVIRVPAPAACPHCQGVRLWPSPDVYKHTQEDIVLVPRTRVTRFEHAQCVCADCRRTVYQLAEGELPGGCVIGPVTRAVAIHLRYDLQIPYRKVQHVLRDLFGMPLVPASAMNFDRQATKRGLPLYEDLKAKLRSSPVVYGDETTWREDGQGHFVWFAGNDDVAVYQITDNRAAASAVELLGETFDGALVTDDYAGWNAAGAADRQTCWNHLRTKAKEVGQQVELAAKADPPVSAPRSAEFCRKLQRFAVKLCALGRQKKAGKLSLRRARAMIPALERELARVCGDEPLENAEAQTLRQRVTVKDRDKLFTFLRVKGVEPTNNHSERSLRFLVIMRKVCFGTRSAAGSTSHGVLPSLLQTARRQGKEAIGFLVTLLTKTAEEAQAALFTGSG
jgi:transposase